MSTAVLRQNALFDFGDILKSGIATAASDASAPGSHLAAALSAQQTMDVCRGVRLTLSRMNSSPSNVSISHNSTTSAVTTTLVNNLLGNLTQHHRRLERTQSAPAHPSVVLPAAAAAAAAVNTSRYKTELCRPFEEFGVCKYGDKCQFAHGPAELRTLARHPKYKTELCRTYHTVGFCPYGPRCHFVHNQDEAVRVASANMASRSPPPGVQHQQQRPRPIALSPTLSLDSPSPPCSLSQSPTSSMGSFFSSEPELNSPGSSGDEQRLPVFNKISSTPIPLLALSDLLKLQ